MGAPSPSSGPAPSGNERAPAQPVASRPARAVTPAPATRLRLMVRSPVPVEADSISPDRFAGLMRDQVRALPLFHGNKQKTIGDLFEVEGDGGETIEIEGDLSKIKKLGLGMTRGRLVVRGSAGLHLGAEMKGGEIEVFGNVDDWAGAEMKGGLIHIHGNAGHRVGAGYRGSEVGMRRGAILVDGSTGVEIGAFMRRGLIAVGGDAGDFAGTYMIAGSILVFGRLGARPGAAMRRGTLVTLNPVEPLPTFRDSGTHRFPFLRLLLEPLRHRGMKIPEGVEHATFRRWVGDGVELGLGEILALEAGGGAEHG